MVPGAQPTPCAGDKWGIQPLSSQLPCGKRNQSGRARVSRGMAHHPRFAALHAHCGMARCLAYALHFPLPCHTLRLPVNLSAARGASTCARPRIAVYGIRRYYATTVREYAAWAFLKQILRKCYLEIPSLLKFSLCVEQMLITGVKWARFHCKHCLRAVLQTLHGQLAPLAPYLALRSFGCFSLSYFPFFLPFCLYFSFLLLFF